MFCPRCGTEFDGKFCPKCGASTDTNQQTNQQVNQTYTNPQGNPTFQPVQQTKKKNGCLIAFLITLGICAFLFVMLIVIAVVSQGPKTVETNNTVTITDTERTSDETNPTGSITTTSTTTSTTTVTTTTATTTTTEPKKENVYNVGETLNDDGLKITFEKAEKWQSDNQFAQPEEGYMFIRAYFSVENTSRSDKSVGSFSFDCYVDGRKMSQSYYGDEQLPSIDTISSGRKTSGYVYFEVPVSAKEIEIEYEINIWTSKKAIFVVKI